MRIEKVDSLDYLTLRRILTSNKITEAQKTQFIKNNRNNIAKIVKTELGITETEFTEVMKNRPLIKFRPLKNSFTKRGDKILLAKTLGIEDGKVNEYIKNVTEGIKKANGLENIIPQKTFEALKTYIYRHGSKDELVTFLDYELTHAKDKLKTLYSTLEYHTDGIADYFIRPIHRFDNKTLISIYNVVDKHIQTCKDTGLISAEDNDKIAKWALYKIYSIQNNNKLINAVKTYKTLK